METSQDTQKDSILSLLKSKGEVTTLDLSKELKLDHQVVVGICKSLEIKEIVSLSKEETKRIILNPDGELCSTKGGPDVQILKELKSNGPQTKKHLQDILGKGICDKGFSAAMKTKTIQYDKATDTVSLKVDVLPDKDPIKENLLKMKEDADPSKYENKLLKDYTHKYIEIEVTKYFKVNKGVNFDLGDVKYETDLTTDLLVDGKWEKTKFKKYNYNALGKDASCGALHRLLEVRNQIRQIFLEQGFEEMPTNIWVESSFWNFDTLFQPQQHPSRDAHDTFFLKNPSKGNIQKKYPEFFERVREMHEVGGYGSLGWQYKWSGDEAQKNILRTHTTAVSSRMLYLLAEDYKKTGKFTPKKYFSIDRVFRNESLDNTHLAEFHQIEGFIADYNLGLGHLIGTIEQFFKRFGINKLRFKPAYNPYTEPSMEVFAYMDVSKKWVEIGNSGIFRPEMIRPIGIPEGVAVIAWGLSLERPTMIHYRLDNIRALFGHEVNLKHTQDASIYYLKE